MVEISRKGKIRMKKPDPLNLTYQGITMNINRWATYAGVNRGMLRNRVVNWVPLTMDVFKGTRIEGKKLNVKEIERTIEKISYEKRAKKRPNCGVCGFPVKNYISNNQVYCRYTEAEQKKFNTKLSPCQKLAKNDVTERWKHRLVTGQGSKIVDSVASLKAIHPTNDIVDFKRRKCIGILVGEIGEHKFNSSGSHHRVCNKCRTAVETRGLYDKPVGSLGNQPHVKGHVERTEHWGESENAQKFLEERSVDGK
jgi:hypothetical protein